MDWNKAITNLETKLKRQQEAVEQTKTQIEVFKKVAAQAANEPTSTKK